MRMRVLGIALAVLALGSFAFGGEYAKDDLRMIGEGRGLYLAHCSGCHGAALQGGEALAPKAPALSPIDPARGGFSRSAVAAHVRFGYDRRLWQFTSREDGEMPRFGSARAFGESDASRLLAIVKLTRYLEYAQPHPVVLAATR